MNDIWFTLDSNGFLLVSYDGGDPWYYSDPQWWGDVNFSSYKPGEPSGPEAPPSANYVPADYTPIIYSGGGSGGGSTYQGYPTRYMRYKMI